MRFGIIAALEPEASVFRHTQGQLFDGHEYVVLVSGPGQRNAGRAAERLIQAQCDVLVSWGVAGALSASLKAGDLIVAGHVMEISGETLWFDESVSAAVAARLGALLPYVGGKVLTVASAAASAPTKSDLYQRYGADAVDLESSHIALVAQRAGRHFLCVRTIVDESNFTVPAIAFNGMDETGKMRLARTLTAVMRHPGQIPQLLRLAGHFRKSINTLRLAASMLTI